MIETQQKILVVAALFHRDGAILVQQRPAHKAQGLLWEFPGGKVEPGESEAAALLRECDEELGVQVRVGTEVWRTEHAYGNRLVTLAIWHAMMPPMAAPEPRDAAQLAWVPAHALPQLAFCPADIPFVERLAAGEIVLDASTSS
jgi:8-oxo-dGTP diphosphatase